jgi:hypothetical protein
LTLPRTLVTKGGSEYEAYPLPSSRLGSSSRCASVFLGYPMFLITATVYPRTSSCWLVFRSINILLFQHTVCISSSTGGSASVAHKINSELFYCPCVFCNRRTGISMGPSDKISMRIFICAAGGALQCNRKAPAAQRTLEYPSAFKLRPVWWSPSLRVLCSRLGSSSRIVLLRCCVTERDHVWGCLRAFCQPMYLRRTLRYIRSVRNPSSKRFQRCAHAQLIVELREGGSGASERRGLLERFHSSWDK